MPHTSPNLSLVVPDNGDADGLSETRVSDAFDAVDVAFDPTTGHDHDGSAGHGPRLAQANSHQAPDTDSATSALHHTLGTGANQAAAGNHAHGGTYQPLDADLTAIAALSPADDDLIQRKSGAWTNRTLAQLKADLAIATGDVGGLAEYILSVSLTQLHEHVYQEDHTAECDGAKVTFILAQEFAPETTQVWKNGALLRPGGGNDYTEDTVMYDAITLASAPAGADTLIVAYIAA